MDAKQTANDDRLNQHNLRNILLEGKSCDPVLRTVRKFVSDGKPAEAKEELLSNLRKELHSNFKELTSEKALTKFLDDLCGQVELDK